MREREAKMLLNPDHAYFAQKMLSDLRNEKKHMLFYLTAASTVGGIHREEFKEYFAKEAASEMAHVIEFQNALLGLGVDLTETNDAVEFNHYILSYSPIELLDYALKMEAEVVANYAQRIKEDVKLLQEPDQTWMENFYEDQLVKSREDVDNLRMLLRTV
jgi:hypothetical protein